MNTARTVRPAVALVPVLAAALLLSACGGSSGNASAGGAAPTGGSTARSANGAGPGANRQPGVFGLVAQISGKTLQVQATSSQTAVTYTAATKFTATVATTKQAVKVGSCVVARSAGSGSGGATGTPTARPTQPTAITATEVTITAPTNGRCGIGGGFGGGFGGGGGGFRGGAAGAGAGQATPGTGAPSGGFTGGPGARGFFGGDMAIGKVTSVSASGFTVSAQTFAGRQGSTGSTPTATPSLTTRSVTVTTTGSTTYTTTAAATAKALAVGKCVSARGASDSTGAVTATSIAVTPADNGSCTTRGV